MSLFASQDALQARYTAKKGKRTTRHVEAANEAFEALGDQERYRAWYYPVFKRAAKGFVDLSDLVEKAKGKDTPGSWFIETARTRLGMSRKAAKRKVIPKQ